MSPVCQICGEVIEGGAATTVCPDCATPHHEDCWEWAGGCSTYGCRGGSEATADSSLSPLPLLPADSPALVIDDALTEDPGPSASVPAALPARTMARFRVVPQDDRPFWLLIPVAVTLTTLTLVLPFLLGSWALAGRIAVAMGLVAFAAWITTEDVVLLDLERGELVRRATTLGMGQEIRLCGIEDIRRVGLGRSDTDPRTSLPTVQVELSRRLRLPVTTPGPDYKDVARCGETLATFVGRPFVPARRGGAGFGPPRGTLPALTMSSPGVVARPEGWRILYAALALILLLVDLAFVVFW